MEMSGERTIAAPREQVWAALNDPAILKSCLSGCETLESSSETEMSATATLQIGSTATFIAGKVLLSDLDPPHGTTISAEGQVGMAGSAAANAQIRLHEVAGATKLSYVLHSKFEGGFFDQSQEVVDTAARRYVDQFFDQLTATIGQPVTAAHESEAQMYHLAHEDHDHDQSNPHYFGLPLGVIIAAGVAVISVGLVLAKFIF